jgi:hypothetical protein
LLRRFVPDARPADYTESTAYNLLASHFTTTTNSRMQSGRLLEHVRLAGYQVHTDTQLQIPRDGSWLRVE